MKKLFKVLSLILAINIFATSQSSAFRNPFGNDPVCETYSEIPVCETCLKTSKELATQLSKNLWETSKNLNCEAKKKIIYVIKNLHNMDAQQLGKYIQIKAINLGNHACNHPILYAVIVAGTPITIYYRNGLKKMASMPFIPFMWGWNKLRNNDKIKELKNYENLLSQETFQKMLSNISTLDTIKNLPENFKEVLEKIKQVETKITTAATSSASTTTVSVGETTPITPKTPDSRLLLEKIGSKLGSYSGYLAQKALTPGSFKGAAIRTSLTAGMVGAGTATAKYYFNLF